MNQRKTGIAISYLNIVLHALVGFAYVPILLHYLGQSEFGLYQLMGALIAYFSVMDFGISNALIRYYSGYRALDDKKGMENILAIALRAYSIICVFILVAGCVLYFYIPTIFEDSMTAHEISSAKAIFVLLILNVIWSIITTLYRAVINAHERFIFLKGLETVSLVLQPVLVIVVLQGSPTAFAVAAVQTGLNVVLGLMRIRYSYSKLKIRIRFHSWDREVLRGFGKLAISVFLVVVVDQLFFRTNQVILGIISGTEVVAVYAIAAVIYMNYMALSNAISGVYLPHISAMVTKGATPAELSALFLKVGRWQFFLLALVGTGFAVFGREFIRIWAGDGFEDAYLITLLIIVPFTIDLIQNIGLSILQAQNRYMFRTKVYVLMGIFNLVLAVYLGKRYGGAGCAFATGLAMFLGNGIIMNVYYAKVVKLEIMAFWKSIAKALIAPAVLLMIGLTVNQEGSPALTLMCKIALYTVLYCMIVYLMSFNSDEKAEVRKLAFKFLRRG